MASYRRLPSGLWQAQIFRRGVRDSDSFPNKGAAIAWAGRREAEIMGGTRGEVPNLTVLALFHRYEKEVSEHKKGKRWEVIRLTAMGRDRLASVKLRELDSPHVSDWQERRLKAIKAASVRRERNLLNNVFEIARKEWKWLRANPFAGVRRPKDGRPRKRLATPGEIARLTAEKDALARAIVVTLETGMRAGEIPRAEITGRVAFLADTKNGEMREVPLSHKAIKALGGGVGLTAGSISALFARRCDELHIKGLTFHDLRANAATRLATKLNPQQLARMFGWKDLKQAMTYYRESTADIAKLL